MDGSLYFAAIIYTSVGKDTYYKFLKDMGPFVQLFYLKCCR